MSPVIMISIVVFVFVVAVGVAGWMIYNQYASSKSVEARLDRLTGQQKTPTLESAGILKEPMYPEDARDFMQKILPKLPSLSKYFEQADFRMAPAQFWVMTALFAGFGCLVPVLVRMPIFLMPLGMAMFGAMPFGYVWFLRKQRLNKFAAQLGEALELVARALRAGHSLAAGMHVVSEESPEPVASEFGRVYDEQNLGISVEQAMRNFAERIPNLDLRFFVTAVVIQRQTGGNLAEILDKIGYVIRERIKIKGLVQALTGEGRISGVVLIAMPFGLLLMMMKLNYDYIKMLWEEPLGQQMSVFAVVMLAIGALIIRKIINIKI